MAAPVITGVIALLLQKKANLTPEKVKEILSNSAHKDQHTGAASWSPAFGFGKVDVSGAIDQM